MKNRILIIPILAAIIIVLPGCLTISGTLGYTDPTTGATVGLKVGQAADGKSVRGFAK